MLALAFGGQHRSLKSVLCLGSHCDDIEIGCGGTIIRLTEEYPEASFHWVVFSSDQTRADEARRSADRFLKKIVPKSVVIKDFRGSFFQFIGAEIKEYFEQLKGEVSPDVIFTHYGKDLHQDHRLISELTWNSFRNHLILEYEIPKYDGDFGSPNVFVHLDKSVCKRKLHTILNIFRTQKDKQWFSRELFLSVLRVRGMESNAPSTYAEAFYCRKLILGLGLRSGGDR